MATVAQTPPLGGPIRATAAAKLLDPNICFWVVGVLVYGVAAVNFAAGHFLDQVARDIWQHLSALRALIQSPFHATNPFVATSEPSRHFHPYWVTIALIARAFGWNEWQALAFAGFVSAGVLLSGIFTFGRAFYRNPWGPLALLVAMVFGWVIPVSHTGYHSLGTLIEGMGYPAPLLIGLSLHLWAVVIWALKDLRYSIIIPPLAAFMFATHQLGAIIGFIVASCLIALWPKSRLSRRAVVASAIGLGLLLSAAWPYFNPFVMMLRTGNASWTGDMNYYGVPQLLAAFVPAILGIAGLLNSRFRRRSQPILAALAIFLVIFACGAAGVMIATRFLMPAVLMLHIGLGALLLIIARRWKHYRDSQRKWIFAIAFLIADLSASFTYIYLHGEAVDAKIEGSAYDHAVALTRDIPDSQPVAVYDVAVWPFVATGQRAVSEPWPEPGIHDLAARQQAVEELFDPRLTRNERVALARRWGTRVLIMHIHGAMRREMPPRVIETLTDQSVQMRRSGNFLRFDLY
jgi:hypothetical protein